MEAVTPPITEPNGTPPPEPPKEEPKAPEPPKELVSDKFAALARKEKGIVKARQEISAMKADMERQQSAFTAKMAEFERWQKMKENAKLDPDAYLNEAGLSYGYLTERALKGNQDPNAILEKANQTIAEFKKSQEEDRKKADEAQKTQAQQDWEQRLQNFNKGIFDYIEQNKETYELTTLHGQQNLVFEIIREASRRKQDMTVKDAADKVESYLSDQIDKTMSTSKKFKDKYELKKTEAPKEPGTPTLNNNMNTTTPINPGIITDSERTARALAALNKALGE